MLKELNITLIEKVKCVFNLRLRGGVTLIRGESGIGKTLLYKALRLRNDTLCFDYHNYNYRNMIKDSIETNAKKGMIVVIDNVDFLMTDELSDYIMQKHSEGVMFILFGRKHYSCVQSGTWICDLVRRECEDGSYQFALNYFQKDLDDLEIMRLFNV